MTTDTGTALFAALCDSPEDDARRLVYADWLEENGHSPRAESIRLSVHQRQLDNQSLEAWNIGARLHEIHKLFGDDWNKQLPRIKGVEWYPSYSGLCQGITVYSAPVLRKHESVIFSSAPITSIRIWFVEISSGKFIEGSAEALAGCTRLGHVRKLNIDGMVHADNLGIDQLARSGALKNLRELDISESGHEDDLLHHLARCPEWPSLESLDIHKAWFTPDGLRALASAPILGTLRDLNLERCNLRTSGLIELLRPPGRLSGLRELNLCENDLSTQVIRALAECPFQRLERLNLSFNDLETPAIRAIANSERMSNLRSLDLGFNSSLGDAAAAALAKSPHLGNLVALDLGSWSLKARGVKALISAPWMEHVARLDLSYFTAAGPRGLQALAEADLPGLRHFSLGCSELTDEGLSVLLRASWIPRLLHLSLWNNRLTAEGARQLVEAPLEGLRTLHVNKNRIDDPGKALLQQRFGSRVVVRTAWD
jgi:uncharacterized protein (TIGR02996 family)